MKSKEVTKKSPSKKLVIIAVAAVGAALLGWLGYLWYQSATVNYAQEVAKPLEEALVKAGAVKMCSSGDTGRGPDNRTPWYTADYSIGQDHDKTVQLVSSISKENGYSLNHADQSNVPAQFQATNIDYFDVNSKNAPYNNLQTGKAGLAFSIYNDGPHEISNITCGTAAPITINSDINTSMVEMQVRLPNHK